MPLTHTLPALLVGFCEADDGQLAITQCSGGIKRYTSHNPQDLISNPELLFDAIANSHRGSIKSAISNFIKQPVTDVLYFCMETPTQPSKWMQLQLDPECLQHGEALLLITDIDHIYKQKESASKKSDYFMHMQNHLPDLFYYKDTNSRFLGGNRAWAEYHGCKSEKELIGKSDLDTGRFTKQEAELLLSEEKAMMENGTVLRFKESMKDKNGFEQHYESIKVPIYDYQDCLLGTVGVTRNITEQVEVQTALEKAKLDAEMSARAKASFLAVMSHEIRTPLNGVIGCTFLLDNTTLNEEQQQLTNTIRASGEDLMVIINDILDYSKIEAGELSLDVSEFPFRTLIEDCIELFSQQMHEKRLVVNYFIEPDVPEHLEGDSTRIRQVLNNLIGNAVKFTEQGEVFTHVQLLKQNTSDDHSVIKVSVKDTGIGIAEDNQKNLFDPFIQGDNSITRKFGGTGLGLAICKKIVQQMGGEFWVQSKLGQGATFHFTLALKHPQQNSSPYSYNHLPSFDNINALVVDDNDTSREVLMRTLEYWGVNTTTFEKPEACIEYLNKHPQHPFDIIILDFCMPNIHGGHLADEIKHIPHLTHTPIVLLSSAQIAKEDYTAVDTVLLKPVRHNSLKKSIQKLLGKTSETQQTTNKSSAATQKHHQILVVEDNPVNQMVLTMMLKKLGYHKIRVVSDGEEAVEIVNTQDFDYIFMDIQMERMDGFTATRIIRQQQCHQPWIIALTAGVQEEHIDNAFKAGMNDFTTKPIQFEELENILNKPTSNTS